MNNYNKKMLEILAGQLCNSISLDIELKKIIKSGFINKNDCFILKSLSQKHIKINDFIDKTGYECFINSIHIDDYVDSNFLCHSLLYIKELINSWENFNKEEKIEIILIETDYGFCIKWHVIRQNEDWLNVEDLETINEGIFICNSK